MLKPCPVCGEQPVREHARGYDGDYPLSRYACGDHLVGLAMRGDNEPEKSWNHAVARYKPNAPTMADAFVDIARELAAIDVRKAPDHEATIQAQFEYLAACVPDIGTALECDDLQGARTEATRVAALAVRLLLALPGGES